MSKLVREKVVLCGICGCGSLKKRKLYNGLNVKLSGRAWWCFKYHKKIKDINVCDLWK